MEKIKKTVSVIVPVFNEEKTVAYVVKTLLANELIDEVLCVNDGSTDKSLDILNGFSQKITLIDLGENKGKGFALAQGIKKARGDIVAFFDADLIGLSDKHIETLLNPILNGRARFVVGQRKMGRFIPSLCGERAYFKQDLMPCLDKIAGTRFGVEVFLTNFFSKKGRKKVRLTKLRGLYKYEKHDLSEAILEYISEGVEIAQELGKREVLSPEDSQVIAALSKEVDFDGLFGEVCFKIHQGGW